LDRQTRMSSSSQSMARKSWLGHTGAKLAHSIGVDRSIAYWAGSRLVGVLGSTGTVLLIVHFLSRAEQGYYYTLLSLANLQVIFELGFSLVIQQFAAHESAHLTFLPDGGIEGDARAHERLALLLRRAVKWYSVAAILMGAAFFLIGLAFFSRHREAGEAVAWQWPFYLMVLGSMAVFFIDPLLSFLDGCGQVRQVARIRLMQAIVSVIAAWSSLFSHHGLFSPSMVVVGTVVVGAISLWRRRRLLLRLLRYPARANAISWKGEVWSFQWKIAVSWFCSYFITQLFTPVVFQFRGAAEAGQMGMSMNITGYLWTLVLVWMTTKSTPFGQLVACANFIELDRTFFRTLRQSFLIFISLAVVCMICVFAMPYVYPRLAGRIATPTAFALLIVGALGAFIMQSEAVYLRAHKYEPYLWLSVVMAILTLTGASLLTPRWGLVGAAATYGVCTGIIGALWATAIFFRRRRKNLAGHIQSAVVAKA
jgi:O-antigen/teichoic acid export membrane protein